MTGTSAFPNTTFLGAGTKSFGANAASTTNFFIDSTSGAVTAPSSLLSIAGNYSNSGTFTHNSGTVYLSGTSQQTLSGTLTGASAFNILNILNTSGTGGGTQSIIFGASASTTGALTMAASTSAQFLASATSSFASLAFNGTSTATRVWLRSSSAGTRYGFVVLSGPTLLYTNARDANSCGDPRGVTIDASDSSNFDGDNNCGWIFPGANPLLAAAANQTFTFGDPATLISGLTITDAATPTITATNSLRIAIATSSTFMLWDTAITSATFGGTALAKISNPISYEGGGSVLVIPVGTNFSSMDTLTISGLSFKSFTAASAPLSGLKLFTGGASDQTADASNSKTVAIKGTVIGAEHSAAQVTNAIDSGMSSFFSLPLYVFNLALAGGENMSVTTLPFSLSNIQGVRSEDITNATLFIDYNGNKAVDAGDTQVGGTGTVSIAGENGTLTFSAAFTATTTRDYLVRADFANVEFSDGIALALTPAGVIASGLTSLLATTPASSVALTIARHIKIPRGGTTIGGPTLEGQGIRGGGGQGGGKTIESDPPTASDEQTIGRDPDFFAPTTSDGTFNQWTTPDNGFASDNAYATAATSWFRQDYGRFGFSVPGTNTINGISVKLELSGSTAAGTISVALSWNGGTSTTTVQTSPTLTTSDAVVTLGGPSNTWGRTWSPTDFSNANFKVRLVAQPSDNTVRVDAIQVDVHDIAGGGGQGGGGMVFAPNLRNFASVYQGSVESLRATGALLKLFLQKLSLFFASF